MNINNVDRLPPSLEIVGLNKRYKSGVWATKDLNLIANSGEIIGILGPNGAGKTTLIKQITTELQPSSGSIRVMGYDVVANPNLTKSFLGIVPQEAELFDYLSVYQHLRIFGKLRGLSDKASRKRADQLVADLRLVGNRDTEVKKLSGGLRRRLLIGIAALASPPLMVLDEPTTGLDPQSRRDLWELLKNYRDEGASVILTTHYMEEAEELCGRIGIIKDGVLLDLDTIGNLRNSYLNDYKLTARDYNDRRYTDEYVTIYGSNYQQLTTLAEHRGFQNVEISKTRLEDIYLALNDPNIKNSFADN